MANLLVPTDLDNSGTGEGGLDGLLCRCSGTSSMCSSVEATLTRPQAPGTPVRS